MTHRTRSGFTMIEVVVAIVLLAVVAVALVGSSRITSASVRRATLELHATQLINGEVERLRTIPMASFVDGSATYPIGTSVWTVTDSGTYLRGELVIQTAPVGGSVITDTLYVYRPK